MARLQPVLMQIKMQEMGSGMQQPMQPMMMPSP